MPAGSDRLPLETLWDLGGVEYPLTQATIGPACEAVEEMAKAWRKYTGGLIDAEHDLGAAEATSCSEKYGVGRCHWDLSPEERTEFNTGMRRLCGLARLPPVKKFGVSMFGLFLITPPFLPSASDDPPPEPRLVLLLATVQNPLRQCFVRCEAQPSLAIAIGSVVEAQLSVENLIGSIDMAWWMEAGGGCANHNIEAVEYTYLTLSTFLVSQVRDVTAEVARLSTRTLDPELAFIKKMLADKRRTLRQYNRVQRFARKGRGKGKGGKGGKGKGKGKCGLKGAPGRAGGRGGGGTACGAGR